MSEKKIIQCTKLLLFEFEKKKTAMADIAFSFKSIVKTILNVLCFGLAILAVVAFVGWVWFFVKLTWRPYMERAEAVEVPPFYFYPYRARSIAIAQSVRNFCMDVKKTFSAENLTLCRKMINDANDNWWGWMYKYSGSVDNRYHFDDLEWEMAQLRIRQFDSFCDDVLVIRALKHCQMISEIEWHCPLTYAIIQNYPSGVGIIRPYDKVTEAAYYLCTEAWRDPYWVQACKCANVMMQCVDRDSKSQSPLCKDILSMADIYGYENSVVIRDMDKIVYK